MKSNVLRNMRSFNYKEFQIIFLDNLSKYPPVKKIHCSQKIITKNMRKAIIHRSRLTSLYLKDKSVNSWNSYEETFFLRIL